MKRWRARLLFEPRDLWIGVYWTGVNKSSPPGVDPRYLIYICIVPCFPIRVELF
jgi:hypothetical protein